MVANPEVIFWSTAPAKWEAGVFLASRIIAESRFEQDLIWNVVCPVRAI